MGEREEDVQIGDCRLWNDIAKGVEWTCEGESIMI